MLEKRRYLRLKLEREGSAGFTAEEAKHAVYEAVFSLLGEGGAAKANVQAKEFDPAKQEIVIKCATRELDNVIAALAAKVEFRGAKAALRLLKVSGAISRLLPPSGKSGAGSASIRA